jgi:hypothetical protein
VLKLARDAAVAAGERCIKLSHKLLEGIALDVLTPCQNPVATGFMTGPVRQLVQRRTVITSGFSNCRRERQLNHIVRRPVVGAISTVTDDATAPARSDSAASMGR